MLEELRHVLGPGGAVGGEGAYSPWANVGTPLAILRPADTAQVAAVLRIASAHGVPVCPWGGLTGLVEGTFADGMLALSLSRMAAIETVDADQATMVVQAGLLLPLDLGARGSATIGGVISTNAGGNRVLRFGMMRDMVLGLEAVLADGSVVSAMKPLIKNNTGYDLKQLFIGSEGTLGVVTRAVLRLRPAPRQQCTALLAVTEFAALVRLLRLLERALAGALSAFEVMWPEFYDIVTTAPALGRPVLPRGAGFYVLVEAMGADAAQFAEVLAAAMADGLVAAAVVAQSDADARRIWALRDDVGQIGRDGLSFRFDVSLAIGDMQAYVAAVRAAVARRWPVGWVVVFGHFGDGNLHLVIGVGDAGAARAVEEIVYGGLTAIGGSVSAEHGIGLKKRDWLGASRSAEEVAMMRAIKRALDPAGILNRGKVFEMNCTNASAAASDVVGDPAR
jgi:FAD/FMN-containing dehydrogenase